MSKDIRIIREDCCNIWNNLKDKTQMIDCLIESKQQIADLEAKLAESKEQLIAMNEKSNKIKKESYYLKQQLVEKEEKLGKAKSLLEEKLLDKTKKYLDLLNLVKQDKISFAVEQLNKTKQRILQYFYNIYDGINVIDKEELDYIFDNQIEELKKEMK